MNAILDIDLERLRAIGQTKWDLVAALGSSAPPLAELDSYLITAVELLRRGSDDGAVADYFIDVSTECLGVDTGSGIRERALLLVTALREYLDEAREV